MQDDRSQARSIVRAWFRHILTEKGWTANEWANAAHTSPTNITRLLSGRGNVPTVETIYKLARVARSQPDLIAGPRPVEVPPVIEHPLFCPQCGYNLAKVTPPRKLRRLSP